MSSAAHADIYDIPPTVPVRVVDIGYFGTHLHRAVATRNDPATPWPVGEIGALRLCASDLRWADIEPARGRYRFDRFDAYMRLAQTHGAAVLLTLGSAPRWAAARPDEPGPFGPASISEPADMSDWDAYITTVARRYKGRIAQYEVWNEPYFSDLAADRGQPSAFFSGSVATMVELTRRARAVLDQEDPSAVLLTPGFVGGVQRFDMFLAAGGGKYVGGVAYHYYASDDEAFISLHRAVRKTMARHSLAALPVYNTETGYEVAERPQDVVPGDRKRAAVLLARSLLLGAYLGIERYYQYAWDNTRSGMVVGPTHEPTPSRAAYMAVRRWMVGTELDGCHRLPGDVVQCNGKRERQRLSIYWRAHGDAEVPLRLASHDRIAAVEWATEPDRAADIHDLTKHGLSIGADPVAVWWQPSAAAGELAQ